jgi:hypothetical protein
MTYCININSVDVEFLRYNLKISQRHHLYNCWFMSNISYTLSVSKYLPSNFHMLAFDIKPRAKNISQDRLVIILNSVKNRSIITNVPYFFECPLSYIIRLSQWSAASFSVTSQFRASPSSYYWSQKMKTHEVWMTTSDAMPILSYVNIGSLVQKSLWRHTYTDSIVIP